MLFFQRSILVTGKTSLALHPVFVFHSVGLRISEGNQLPFERRVSLILVSLKPGRLYEDVERLVLLHVDP